MRTRSVCALFFVYYFDRFHVPPFSKAGLLSSRSHALRGNARLAALRHMRRGASESAFPRGAWERVNGVRSRR
jgi:hypothetical protein